MRLLSGLTAHCRGPYPFGQFGRDGPIAPSAKQVARRGCFTGRVNRARFFCHPRILCSEHSSWIFD